MRLIGKNGIDLIKSYEKLRLTAYMPTPNDRPTIGWGKTSGVKMGMTCTAQQADEWLIEDLRWVEDAVSRVTVYLTQNMTDALCSFVYNVGKSAFVGSTLFEELNKGHYWRVPDELRCWNKQAGKVLNGLTNRRQAEVELFTTPDGARWML